MVDQHDWIYALAVIADGASPRRDLPLPRPAGRPAPVGWLGDLLNAGLHPDYSCRVAQALGSFGVFVSEMVPPLRFLFTNRGHRFGDADRDEALVYLGMIGTPEVVPILIEAADTPPGPDNDDYLYSRGLFGLLLLDDVDVLAEQIRKAPPHLDLNAYAYGLAGSRDPRGRVLLERLRHHSDERVRAAVARACAAPWMSGAT